MVDYVVSGYVSLAIKTAREGGWKRMEQVFATHLLHWLASEIRQADDLVGLEDLQAAIAQAALAGRPWALGRPA